MTEPPNGNPCSILTRYNIIFHHFLSMKRSRFRFSPTSWGKYGAAVLVSDLYPPSLLIASFFLSLVAWVRFSNSERKNIKGGKTFLSVSYPLKKGTVKNLPSSVVLASPKTLYFHTFVFFLFRFVFCPLFVHYFYFCPL